MGLTYCSRSRGEGLQGQKADPHLRPPPALDPRVGIPNYSFLHVSLLSSPGLWPRSPDSVSATIADSLCLGVSGLS